MADKNKEPEIAEEKIIEYTQEELDTISELVEYYTKAPGQVEILDDLDAEDAPEGGDLLADIEDIPDLDSGIDTLSAADTIGGDLDSGLGDLKDLEDLGGLDDLGSLDDLGKLAESTPVATDSLGGLDDLGDIGDIKTPYDDIESNSGDTSYGGAMMPPSLEDLSPEVALQETSVAAKQTQTEEFSDEQIRELRRALKNYPPGIRKAIIDAIVEDQLNDHEAKQLTERVIGGADAAEIKTYLENKTGNIVDDTPKVTRKKSKVVLARPQYTEEGLKRQARILRFTRWSAVAVLGALFLLGALWFWVAKPMLYNSRIASGKELILKNTEKNFKEAEEVFKTAREMFPNRVSGFLIYADAYKQVKQFDRAFVKLYGDLTPSKTESRSFQIRGPEYWRGIKKVPIARYAQNGDEIIEEERLPLMMINDHRWKIKDKGAYIISHLDKKKNDAKVLVALGEFHSNAVPRFKSQPYRNNLLGIDYFKRVYTFDTKTPLLSKDYYISRAIMGVGDVYYNQKDYYRSLNYYDKIRSKNPKSVVAQTGVLKALLKIAKAKNDPRMVIQQHAIIKHKLGIEKKLPIFMLARLAGFYIDLPEKDGLRIKYNLSQVDSVNQQALKQKAHDLLLMLTKKEEKDGYGNKNAGYSFAEGYYQWGRYYRYVAKKMRMAMKQMELAYSYDSRHFMALNDRAEMLIEIHDYNAAVQHLEKAKQQLHPGIQGDIGDKPEHETLLDADKGKIYFNLGKAKYLNLIKDLSSTNDWKRMQEADKYQSANEVGIESLRKLLSVVEISFEEARRQGLKDKEALSELYYFKGWAAYVQDRFDDSLENWENMTLIGNKRYKNLELAKSHALYQLSLPKAKKDADRKVNLNKALGYLFFLQEHYLNAAQKIVKPSANNKLHVKLFTRLTIIENNIGAIYELLDNEDKALVHYMKSVDFSKRIARENEIANSNIRLRFRRTGLEKDERYPIIMDFIPPQLLEDTI